MASNSDLFGMFQACGTNYQMWSYMKKYVLDAKKLGNILVDLNQRDDPYTTKSTVIDASSSSGTMTMPCPPTQEA